MDRANEFRNASGISSDGSGHVTIGWHRCHSQEVYTTGGRSSMSGTRRTALADTEPSNQQQLVNERFDSHAQDWDDLYQKENLFSVIIRHRHDRALGWIDDLEL